ncbi:MAG: Aminopeptidase [Gemmatimonadetes bacterium]|nr:Aminopeptidase [Gemmatimonadota bacterium]
MSRCRSAFAACSAALSLVARPLPAQLSTSEALARIQVEGREHSHVMEMARTITDYFGPRLTNSPEFERAATWAVQTAREFGATADVEPWGPMEWPQWSNERFSLRMDAPASLPLTGFPAAWSASTAGRRTGDVVFVDVMHPDGFARYRGALRGKWVVAIRPGPILPAPERKAARLSAEQLIDLEKPLVPQVNPATPLPGDARAVPSDTITWAASHRARCAGLSRLLMDEGALGLLAPAIGHDGLLTPYDGMCAMGVRASVIPPLSDGRSPTPPVILLAPEAVGRLLRLTEDGVRVRVEAEMVNRIVPSKGTASNVIAELRGSDASVRDEVVMFGAHLDSWHVGTGATDNGGNAAVMLEALRILRASGVPLRRTVRLALWSGEEQGLLGSTAYVRQHFGTSDERGRHLTPEYDRLAVYFNLDNGVGSIRGVYLQGNAAAAPMLSAWMTPLHDLGVTAVSARSTGGTDHVPFAALGLPAFQLIQDPLEYTATTWHTSQDTFERLPVADLTRNAVTIASLVYQAANAEHVLPRRSLPQ